MEDIRYNEETLVESREVREKYMERLDVLDKVKQLFLIPGMECLTATQVADFYEVDAETIKKVRQRNSDEFAEDGVHKEPITSFRDFNRDIVSRSNTDVVITPLRGCIKFAYKNTTVVVPNTGITVYPKRAVLRMGMLLRDSKVAKEVRTQLLNTFEKATVDQRVGDIETEQGLLMDIAKAFSSGEVGQLMQASQALDVFRKRHIESLEQQKAVLEEEKTILAGEANKWANRACLSKVMRTFAAKLHTSFQSAYAMLFTELLYKHRIGLKMRGKKPYVQWLKPEEYNKAYQSIAALCESCGLNTEEVFAAAKMSLEDIKDEQFPEE